MKLIDVYTEYKKSYKEYVLIIESGIFYNVYNNDAGIINRLLNYKIKCSKEEYIVGFPVLSLHQVIEVLKKNSINYLVLDKDHNKEYYISDKYKDNHNQYNKFVFDYKRRIYLNNRIDDIHNKLLKMIDYRNIEDILIQIERLL